MGKTGKWLKNFLTGKKDKGKEKGKFVGNQNSSNATENPTTPTSTTPKEKRRWSFRRSSATATASRELNFADQSNSVPTAPLAVQSASDAENEQRKHAIAVAAATAAAADVAVAAAQAAAAAAIHLNSVSNGNSRSIEEAAAIKIQSAFRSFLARKALCALRGLVKLQALVRGHLVRKQATATLRCMQALVTAQARARCQRICKSSELTPTQRLSTHRQLGPDEILRQIYNEMDRGLEENIKIVEMDVCESKGNPRSGNSNSNTSQHERPDRRFSTYYSSNGSHSKEENCKVLPAPSALTEFSPRTCSGHFEDFSFGTAQSSPHYYSAVSRAEDSKLSFSFPRPAFAESMSYDYPLYPNYMANTESSRAKARSHSAPKQRPDSLERQPSRRRASVEGRNVPRPVRMQRSSSHVGVTAQNYHYPWSIKLDRSTVSLIESECGSTTSTVLTNNDYCRSLAAFDANGNRY